MWSRKLFSYSYTFEFGMLWCLEEAKDQLRPNVCNVLSWYRHTLTLGYLFIKKCFLIRESNMSRGQWESEDLEKIQELIKSKPIKH